MVRQLYLVIIDNKVLRLEIIRFHRKNGKTIIFSNYWQQSIKFQHSSIFSAMVHFQGNKFE